MFLGLDFSGEFLAYAWVTVLSGFVCYVVLGFAGSCNLVFTFQFDLHDFML